MEQMEPGTGQAGYRALKQRQGPSLERKERLPGSACCLPVPGERKAPECVTGAEVR